MLVRLTASISIATTILLGVYERVFANSWVLPDIAVSALLFLNFLITIAVIVMGFVYAIRQRKVGVHDRKTVLLVVLAVTFFIANFLIPFPLNASCGCGG